MMNRNDKIRYLNNCTGSQRGINEVGYFKVDPVTGLYYYTNEPDKRYTKDQFNNLDDRVIISKIVNRNRLQNTNN